MLEFKNLIKIYGKVKAVDNLNLKVDEGEFFGLLGPNGAGKTTTIRMLSTLTPQTSGEIILNEKNLNRTSREAKASIGVVPQHLNLDREMTAWENLELHGRLYGMPKTLRRQRIEELLQFVGLADRANDIVNNFSGGMKRKVMIARALMHSPKVLLLDEPTVGLDAAVRRKIWDLMKELNKQGMTVILTTHYIEEAETLCTKVGLMNGGKLVELNTPNELVSKVGNFVVEYFEDGQTVTKFFDTREEAHAFAAKINGDINIRASNLEDVFIKLTNRRVKA